MEKQAESLDAPQSPALSREWETMMEEFGIREHGKFKPEGFMVMNSKPPRALSMTKGKKTGKRTTNRVKISSSGPFVYTINSRWDFVQSLAGADEMHLNLLMRIFTDIIIRGCCPDRLVDGNVQRHLDAIQARWRAFSEKCQRLETFCRQIRTIEEQKKRDRNEREEEDRKRKRQRVRDLILNRSSGAYDEESEEEGETERNEEEEEEEENTFHSDLLREIGRRPSLIYQDTKNIRICVLFCMMAKSKYIQNLVCLGRFVSESMECKLEYVPIPKPSLDELISFTKTLRNSFMTGQSSPLNCVKTLRLLVERGGVHAFRTEILDVARREETKRLSAISNIQ